MTDDEQDEQQHLAEVVARVRAGRKLLSMTIYAIQRKRRTPEQVRAVLERSIRAIRRNQLVRMRWTRKLAVH